MAETHADAFRQHDLDRSVDWDLRRRPAIANHRHRQERGALGRRQPPPAIHAWRVASAREGHDLCHGGAPRSRCSSLPPPYRPDPCLVLWPPPAATLNSGDDLNHAQLPLTPYLRARIESPNFTRHSRRDPPDGYERAEFGAVSDRPGQGALLLARVKTGFRRDRVWTDGTAPVLERIRSVLGKMVRHRHQRLL